MKKKRTFAILIEVLSLICTIEFFFFFSRNKIKDLSKAAKAEITHRMTGYEFVGMTLASVQEMVAELITAVVRIDFGD